MPLFDEAFGKKILDSQRKNAREIMSNMTLMNEFVKKLNKKVISDPFEGDQLIIVILLIDIITCYAKGEYTKISKESLETMLAGLYYWESPFDVIPDIIPGIGLMDDQAVMEYCLKCVSHDVDDFNLWRISHPQKKDIQKNPA